MKVLVTCPPMIGAIGVLAGDLATFGLDATTANVVQVLSEDELIELLPSYDGWIMGDDPCTRRVLEAGKSGHLKAVVKWGVGVDNVDFEACHELGVPVTNTPGMFGREVAEVALGYVICLARETVLVDRQIRAGAWPKPQGISLSGKTVVLVGFGNIGQETARRLLALNVNVVACDPEFHLPANLDAVRPGEWPRAVKDCDFIIFSCPLTEQTRHMFNRETLVRLKPGVRVINVSRGAVIEEAALIEGLTKGIVHSAALDVFEVEPLPLSSPLRQFERCVFGSHNSSNTYEAVLRASRNAIRQLAEFLESS